MVVVYFESGSHAEVAAIFSSESEYDACYDELEKQAKEAGMVLTESVRDWHDINDVVKKFK